MSKEKPEVGDVWEDNKTKKPIYIYLVSIKRLEVNMSVGVIIGKKN